MNHIWQILLYTRRVFHKIDASQPSNPEAAALFERAPEGFAARARSCVTDWKEQVYLTREHDDPHYLTFSLFDPSLHGAAREQLKRGAARAEGGEGAEERRSYVAPGSLTIFSEELVKDNQNQGPKSMPK